MKRWALPLLLSFVALVAACPQHKAARPPATASPHVREGLAGSFRDIAPAQYLGQAWGDAGGADGVRAIWADPSGQRVLIVLRGEGVPALWLDRERSQEAKQIQLGRVPAYVDMVDSKAYALTEPDDPQYGGYMVWRSLPDDDWQVDLPDQPTTRGTQLIARHAASKYTWRIVLAPPAEGSGDVANSAQGVTAVFTAADSEPTGIPLPTIIDRSSMQLAAFSDGEAAAAVDGKVYLLNPNTSSVSESTAIYSSSGRDILIAADPAAPVLWVYVKPQAANAGSGREAHDSLPGEVIVFDASGKELRRAPAGSVPLSQVAGNWRERRCLLASSSIGVACVELETGKMGWPLRQGGDVPLFLLPTQLLAILPDGIVGIGTDDLLQVAPRFLASIVLPRKTAQEARSACEALGWDWKRVQVSPLLSQTGRLTLFDNGDGPSEVAEMDWSSSRHHASRLLLTRPLIEADHALRSGTAEQAQEAAGKLLAALGWSSAKPTTPAAVTADETQLTYALSPDSSPDLGQGEFSIWATNESILMDLHAPVAAFPAHTMDADKARELGLAEAARRAGVADHPEHASVMALKGGWAELDAALPQVAAEPEVESIPVWEVRAAVDGPQPEQYTVLLNAESGEVVQVKSGKGSPLLHMARKSVAK